MGEREEKRDHQRGWGKRRKRAKQQRNREKGREKDKAGTCTCPVHRGTIFKLVDFHALPSLLSFLLFWTRSSSRCLPEIAVSRTLSSIHSMSCKRKRVCAPPPSSNTRDIRSFFRVLQKNESVASSSPVKPMNPLSFSSPALPSLPVPLSKALLFREAGTLFLLIFLWLSLIFFFFLIRFSLFYSVCSFYFSQRSNSLSSHPTQLCESF